MSSFSEEKKIAIQAVQKAALIVSQLQGKLQENYILQKEDLSPVTVADLISQAIIILHVRERFPNDAIVAEEDAFFLKDPVILEKMLSELSEYSEEKIREALNFGKSKVTDKGRYWVLDPIDGTKGYIRGDHYAVALALIVDCQVVLGVLGCPRFDALFFAEKNGGAFKIAEGKQERLICDPSQFAADELIYCEPHLYSKTHPHTTTYKIATALKTHVKPLRLDSQAKYPLVAMNKAALYIRISPPGREKIWDHAAGSLIVQEAGGIVTDLRGHPLKWGLGNNLFENEGIIASNGRDHDQIVKAAKEVLNYE